MNHINYIVRQLRNICPSDSDESLDFEILLSIQGEVDRRFEYLASRIKILARTGCSADPLHVMKHPIYLYLLARTIYENNLKDEFRIKDRLYVLNKSLHGCSIYYKVIMPDVFFLNYASSVVLGDCIYGENLVVYQGVTVGGYQDKVPELGANVVLMPNSVVSGATKLGDNVVVSAGVMCINQIVPSNTIVFGSPNRKSEISFHPMIGNNYIEYFLDCAR
jgi:serine acetyltransferase